MDDILSHVAISFDQLAGLVVTGLGAESSPFPARQVSDISCQAKRLPLPFPNGADDYRHRRTIHEGRKNYAGGQDRRFFDE